MPERRIPDDLDFERYLPDPDPKLAGEGWRLRVSCEGRGEGVSVERERVLPEQLHNPDARAVLESRSFGLMHHDEVRWLHALLGEVVAMLDTPPDTPPVLVESADGAVAATPIGDAPRFRAALLRDVPDGATVSAFPGRDIQDASGIAKRLNADTSDPDWWDARSWWWGWRSVDSEMRADYEDDTPCIVDTRPEVKP